jgi:hypothetical protein
LEIAFSGSGAAAPGVQGKEHRAHTVCLLQSRVFQADFVNASSRQKSASDSRDRPALFTGDKTGTLAIRDSFGPTVARLMSTRLLAN